MMGPPAEGITKVHASPISPELLEPCLSGFPSDARTLPAAAYTSPEVFAWEKEHFLWRSWFCAGRDSDIAAMGDQKAIDVAGRGVLLARGDDGIVRAFFNTCRHRGHELVACSGRPQNDGVIRCPYHRWIYKLDGSFSGGPGMSTQPGFDKNDPDNDLVPVRTQAWGGWIFVNLSGVAEPLEEHLGTVTSLMEAYEPERLILGETHSYDVDANWKIVIENYHECYHCSEIHPELCSVSAPGSGEDYERTGTVIGGSMELLAHAQTMSLDGKSLGVPFRRLSGKSLREVYYLELFPNLLLSVHPDYVMTHRLEPMGCDRTRIECAWHFPPEAHTKRDFSPSYATDFWDITNRQDWAACEAVQRGVRGPGYRQSPFSSQELVVHQSMAMVARGYLQGAVPPLRRAPAVEAATKTET
jgi:glycine betaine catabolism A